MANTQQLSLVSKIYNNSKYSDFVLEFTGSDGIVKYHLMSQVIETSAPLLAALFTGSQEEVLTNSGLMASTSGLVSSANLNSANLNSANLNSANLNSSTSATVTSTPEPAHTPDALLTTLSTLLSKHITKKCVKIADSSVSKETVNNILEYIYGKSTLRLSDTNVREYYNLSLKFGMTELTIQCLEIVKKSIKVDTLIADYCKVKEEGSSLVSIYLDSLIENIQSVPKNDLLIFTTKLSYEEVTSLLKSDKLCCSEELIYDIVENWCSRAENLADLSRAKELYGLVKIGNLTAEFLISRVKTNQTIGASAYEKALEESAVTRIRQSVHRISSTNPPLFAIGTGSDSYSDYKLITSDQLNASNFSDFFRREYNKYNGIYCLDSREGDVISSDTHKIYVNNNGKENNYYMRLFGHHLVKDSFVKFCINGLAPITGPFVIKDSGETYNSSEKCIGLFIHNKVTL